MLACVPQSVRVPCSGSEVWRLGTVPPESFPPPRPLLEDTTKPTRALTLPLQGASLFARLEDSVRKAILWTLSDSSMLGSAIPPLPPTLSSARLDVPNADSSSTPTASILWTMAGSTPGRDLSGTHPAYGASPRELELWECWPSASLYSSPGATRGSSRSLPAARIILKHSELSEPLHERAARQQQSLFPLA